MNPPEKVAPGETYGRLLVVGRLPTEKRQRFYLCRCICGEEVRVAGRHLRSGNTKSCGCLKRETAARNAKETGKRNGASTHPLYYVWKAMIARCCVEHNPSYYNYGARGITVCQRWLDDPQAFYEDMGECPSKYSLDRIDNDGNYEPSNCKWSTRSEQQYNRRKPNAARNAEIQALYRAGGITQAEIGRKYGLQSSTIYRIINPRKR